MLSLLLGWYGVKGTFVEQDELLGPQNVIDCPSISILELERKRRRRPKPRQSRFIYFKKKGSFRGDDFFFFFLISNHNLLKSTLTQPKYIGNMQDRHLARSRKKRSKQN